MSTLNASPLLLREVAAGDDAYQLENSVRFNRADTPYLNREQHKKGDQRRWTWSGWVKKTDSTNTQTLFQGRKGNGSQTAPSLEVQILSGTQLYISFCESDGATIQWSAENQAFYRDPAAWQHWVIVLDTPNAIANERCRVYVNGKRVEAWGTRNAITQHAEYAINKQASHHVIGAHFSGGNVQAHLDGYFSNIEFIDGLCLHPGAFGSFDDSNCWNPKAFALPAPNDGTTWSNTDYWSCGEAGGAPFDNGFDGDTNTIAELDNSGTTGYHTQTFTPPTPIKFSSAVRIHGTGANTEYSVNGGKKVTGLSTGTWQTIYEGGGGEITTIEFTADTNAPAFRAIEVDGVILIDGQTDPTTRNNPNNGTEWSDYLTLSTGAWDGADDPGSAFDGTISTAAENGTAYAEHIFEPPGGIKYKKLEVQSGIGEFQLNSSGSWTSTVNQNQWNTWHQSTTEQTLTKFQYKGSSSASGWGAIRGVRIDGNILIDSTADNSFHLKFNDNSRKSYIGKDALHGKLEDADGGLPIYATTDDYGETKGSGYRTDSSAGTTDGAGLVFALPGDTKTDVHAAINTGSSNSDITQWYAGIDVSTNDSRFYGSSLYCNGSGVLQVNGNATDFTFGTSAWCIELWVNDAAGTDDRGFLHLSGDSGWAGVNGISFFMHQNIWKCKVKSGTAENTMTSTTTAVTDQWVHLAITYDGTNALKYFVNGKLEDSETQAYDFGSGFGGYLDIGAYHSAGYKWTGYLQDIRIYRVQKYSTNFTVPARNDFKVANLTAGSESTVADFNWRPGVAIGTDASRKNNTINNYKSSGDGVVQSSTTGSTRATQSITRTAGPDVGGLRPNNWWGKPPASGTNGALFYAGRGDTEWTFDPPVTAGANITCRAYSDGGTTGNDKIRFYDGGTSTWTSWFDLTAGSNFAWANIATGIQRIDKVGFDHGGGSTDPHVAGFYLDSGLTDANWWRWPNGSDFGITTAGVFDKDDGTLINGDAATTIPSQYTLDYWHAPEWEQKGNGTVFDTETEQTIRDYGSSHSNSTCQRTIKITSTDDGTVYDYYYTTRAFRWNHVRISNTGVWANGTQLQNSQASNYNVPDITASSHRFSIGNYGVSAATSYSYHGLIGPVRLVEADLGAPPAGGLVITDEAGSSTNTTTNTPTTNTESDYDVFVDSPTNYEGSGDDVGGVMRGNYATMNPIARTFNDNLRNITNGNLLVEGNSSSNSGIAESTWNQKTGKWYMEFTYVNDPNDGYSICGMYNTGYQSHHGTGDGSGTSGSACVNISTNTSVFGSTLTTGDVMGMAADLDNGACYFSKNGTWVGTPTSGGSKTGATATWTAGDKSKCIGVIDTFKSGNKVACNWGQRAFKYTPPTGFKSCCTQNLDDTFSGEATGTVNNPSKFFDVVAWAGNGTDNSDIKGLNFQPDLVWIKERGSTGDPHIFDAVRGATKALRTNVTDAEVTDANELKAFNSDGFRLGTGGDVNNSVTTTVGWTWDAGTAANSSTNTDGDNITVAVGKQWVNTTAGFSITEYAGDGSGAANSDSGDAVGHGLNAAPDFIVVKKKDGVNGWPAYHSSLNSTDHLNLQTTGAIDANNYCYPTHPTNEKVDLGNNPEINASGSNYIMYCWTAIPGYSAFGKYTGNGNTDGPFIYTGFLPKLVIIKRSSGTSNWTIMDTERDPINPAKGILVAENSTAENTSNAILDFVSNGFKHRQSSDSRNSNNQTFVYAAWAENPFKIARAR